MPQECRGEGDVTSLQQDGDSGSKVSGGGKKDIDSERRILWKKNQLWGVVSSASRCLDCQTE